MSYEHKQYYVSQSLEAHTSKSVDYLSGIVSILIILSYFFFDNWLIEILIIGLFLTWLNGAFTHYLTDNALRCERDLTNREFEKFHAEIDALKLQLKRNENDSIH